MSWQTASRFWRLIFFCSGVPELETSFAGFVAAGILDILHSISFDEQSRWAGQHWASNVNCRGLLFKSSDVKSWYRRCSLVVLTMFIHNRDMYPWVHTRSVFAWFDVIDVLIHDRSAFNMNISKYLPNNTLAQKDNNCQMKRLGWTTWKITIGTYRLNMMIISNITNIGYSQNRRPKMKNIMIK